MNFVHGQIQSFVYMPVYKELTGRINSRDKDSSLEQASIDVSKII